MASVTCGLTAQRLGSAPEVCTLDVECGNTTYSLTWPGGPYTPVRLRYKNNRTYWVIDLCSVQ